MQYHQGIHILKKTNVFLWMIELCRFTLVLTRFFAEVKFRGGGGLGQAWNNYCCQLYEAWKIRRWGCNKRLVEMAWTRSAMIDDRLIKNVLFDQTKSRSSPDKAGKGSKKGFKENLVFLGGCKEESLKQIWMEEERAQLFWPQAAWYYSGYLCIIATPLTKFDLICLGKTGLSVCIRG